MTHDDARPALAWAREIEQGLRAGAGRYIPRYGRLGRTQYVATGGDVFTLKFLGWTYGFNGKITEDRILEYFVNDEKVDTMIFELRLGEHWPGGTPGGLVAHDIAHGLRDKVRRTPPWHGFLRDKVAKHIAPNGDVFTVRFVRWLHDGVQEHEHAINGVTCDAREFETRLAHHYEQSEAK